MRWGGVLTAPGLCKRVGSGNVRGHPGISSLSRRGEDAAPYLFDPLRF